MELLNRGPTKVPTKAPLPPQPRRVKPRTVASRYVEPPRRTIHHTVSPLNKRCRDVTILCLSSLRQPMAQRAKLQLDNILGNGMVFPHGG